MSHVDEGALHAYLDGALDEYPAAEARRVREHVETCTECAGRLAEARKVREEASAILDLAAPRVEVPTFEELRAYVRTREVGRTTVSMRIYRVGWAASVVLALGTGWMLRGGELVPVTPLERSDGDAGAEVQEGAALEEAAAPTLIQERESDAPAEAPPSEPEALQSARDVGADRVAGLADGNTLNRAEPSAGPPAQTAAAPTDAVQVGAARAAVDPSVDVRTLDAAGGGAGGAFADAPSANAGQRQASDDRAAARIDSAARAIEVERRVTQDQLATSAITVQPAAPTALRARTNEELQTDEDSVSLVVPGLEVLDVLPVGQGTTFAGMRALQRLENGDTLEVVHLPQGVDPALLPVRPFGHNELVRQQGAGWLVLRAPVSEAYLQELLRRLEAGR